MPKAIDARSLPPLEWLRVFEAAARLGNFTGAANELGLTQAAVSQRMRNLEGAIGRPLFIRLPRGVELTVDGEAYAAHVRTALAALQRSTTDLFSVSRGHLSIAASASVISHWINPRLPALLRALPDTRISLLTVHRDVDFGMAEADFDIRFGDGDWPGLAARKAFEEDLTPVVSPVLLGQSGGDWRALPQIAVTGPRDGWLEWATANDVPPPVSPVLRFDTFTLALGAALAGSGVLLGSLSLVQPMLLEGTLVRLSEPVHRMKDGYWICWNPRSASFRGHDQMLDILSGPDPHPSKISTT